MRLTKSMATLAIRSANGLPIPLTQYATPTSTRKAHAELGVYTQPGPMDDQSA